MTMRCVAAGVYTRGKIVGPLDTCRELLGLGFLKLTRFINNGSSSSLRQASFTTPVRALHFLLPKLSLLL